MTATEAGSGPGLALRVEKQNAVEALRARTLIAPHFRHVSQCRFTNHCAGCHTLQFDQRFGDVQVPHDQPEVVHSFRLKRFRITSLLIQMRCMRSNPPNRQLPERVRVLRDRAQCCRVGSVPG